MEHYHWYHDESAVKREKQKARELRRSQWWKRRCAKGVCGYCKKPTPPGSLTMDHIVPLTKGGKTTKNNVIPVCKECNNKKKEQLLMEWEGYPR